MKKFNHTRLWILLCNSELEVSDFDDANIALDDFVEKLHNYCHQTKDLAERIRTLRFAQRELVMAQEQIQNRAKKKCPIDNGLITSPYVNRLRVGYYQNGIGAPRKLFG